MSLRGNGKKKYIVSASCTLLAVITAGVAVMSTTQTALARATLPGVEKIIELDLNEEEMEMLKISADHVRSVMKTLDDMNFFSVKYGK